MATLLKTPVRCILHIHLLPVHSNGTAALCRVAAVRVYVCMVRDNKSNKLGIQIVPLHAASP